jgi:hypothetical protein
VDDGPLYRFLFPAPLSVRVISAERHRVTFAKRPGSSRGSFSIEGFLARAVPGMGITSSEDGSTDRTGLDFEAIIWPGELVRDFMTVEDCPVNADTMGVMDLICVVCLQPISEEERWFRVREEYVHLSCAEKYLRRVSDRRQQAKTAPPKHVPDTGN